MFIVEGNKENARAIKRLLNNFEPVSGLSVNFDKSRAFGVNLSNAEMMKMVEGLGCRIGDLPIPYLGLKVGGRLLGVECWRDFVDKVKGRIRKWDVNSISMAKRVTVIKSVISSLPVYGLSILPLPKNINEQLRGLQ